MDIKCKCGKVIVLEAYLYDELKEISRSFATPSVLRPLGRPVDKVYNLLFKLLKVLGEENEKE